MNFRSGYVAIVGRPNVGKSTLMNQLLNKKLSIVTAKPQTTRHQVLGILNSRNYQIIFLDTPGILKPRYKLHDAMIRAAVHAVYEADIIILMVDVTESNESTQIVVKRIEEIRKSNPDKPLILALNKIDRIDKPKLLPMISDYSENWGFHSIVPISALKNSGINRLLKEIIARLPVNEPFYPSDILSSQPERFFVTEILREKILHHFHDEIPYSTEVQIETFRENKDGKDYIEANIFVEKKSQKGILIGKKGETLKNIGKEGRKDIEEFLGRPVYLKLWVKVRENWRKNERDLKELGYIK